MLFLCLCTFALLIPWWLPVGWEKQSYGFHTDDGNLFNCNEAKKNGPYAEKASTGDVIGCGVDLVERSAFFTLNGSSCGKHFHYCIYL